MYLATDEIETVGADDLRDMLRCELIRLVEEDEEEAGEGEEEEESAAD